MASLHNALVLEMLKMVSVSNDFMLREAGFDLRQLLLGQLDLQQLQMSQLTKPCDIS